mmetsp:Transcript_58867/g.170258  ORF Transcript_58867/g.170258 Transcript_58867/m.170258 type:complete len:274 (-) Transcript_58867:254-1075(-)
MKPMPYVHPLLSTCSYGSNQSTPPVALWKRISMQLCTEPKPRNMSSTCACGRSGESMMCPATPWTNTSANIMRTSAKRSDAQSKDVIEPRTQCSTKRNSVRNLTALNNRRTFVIRSRRRHLMNITSTIMPSSAISSTPQHTSKKSRRFQRYSSLTKNQHLCTANLQRSSKTYHARKHLSNVSTNWSPRSERACTVMFVSYTEKAPFSKIIIRQMRLNHALPTKRGSKPSCSGSLRPLNQSIKRTPTLRSSSANRSHADVSWWRALKFDTFKDD